MMLITLSYSVELGGYSCAEDNIRGRVLFPKCVLVRKWQFMCLTRMMGGLVFRLGEHWEYDYAGEKVGFRG